MGRVGGSGCDPGHAARARKVMVTVAAAWSFDRASAKLRDICSMTVSDDTIERVCQHEGEQARKWLRGEATRRFARVRANARRTGVLQRRLESEHGGRLA